MANCGKDIALTREGSDQNKRFIEALEPGSVKLNDFSLKEWMQFAYRFAAHVNYFSNHDFEDPSGNWEFFFKNEIELEDFLKRVGEEKNITPHLALFICFVWLLEFSKKRFNRLTKRHLDFYYREILKIEKLPATPDKVHILFELAKKVTEEQIGEGTELDGGKDANGQKRIYKTNEELIANKTAVAQLKSVYNDHENSKIKTAEVANSYDGKGEDFPNDDIKWWPFGYFEVEKNGKEAEYPELEDARLGFAVSSNVLKLQEGERFVQLDVKFQQAVSSVNIGQLTNNLEVWCTGEKGWLGPFAVESTVENDEGDDIFTSGLSESSTRLKLAFKIPRDEEPVVAYDSEVHGENFDTDQPVCRVLINTGETAGHSLYRQLLDKEIKTLSIHVDVRGVKSLELESDIGVLNAEKPFYPFGTQPVKRSNFYVNYPELFEKFWDQLDVEINWKNTPDSFVDLYYAYRTDYIYKASSFGFLEGMLTIEIPEIEPVEPVFNWGQVNPEPANLIVKEDSHFEAKIEIQHKAKWEDVNQNNHILFTKVDEGYTSEFSVQNTNYETGKNGPVRMSLNQSFYHDLFPRIYALAFGSENEDALIPNEPYTPMIETISLNYTASASMNLGATEKDFQTNNVKLFHEHPFGQAEEHLYLKNQLDFLDDEEKKTFLLPDYCKGGELYIGLEEAEPTQTVSLLVQVLEGSENPEAESFTGKQKVEWSVLCQNHWKPLTSDFMIANETDNFLKSGIVKFSIPKVANKNNTRLASGFIWVKAKIHKNYFAVSKAIAIHAQAVTAQFSDNGNELSHLLDGLEAETITKPVQRVSTVKGLTQPYASFGGKPQESDAAYYRRLSERLRHKNRAITIWDYEHLILQQFPKIYKVKCLNHTSYTIKQKANGENEIITRFLAPGHVLIIVIPDIENNNVFDIYQPRVSKATLNEIQNFVNERNTLHVDAVVANPEYEEVTVELGVKFRKGFDESYYLKKLNEDITRLLSPWAFKETAKIEFGTTLHRSTLIHYIEKLQYVDYVEDVKMKKGEKSFTLVSPETPIAILVSARQHGLRLASDSCKETVETEEICQK
ncbi:baseplate J/gp47 family protein [Mariniphaga sp.]|uniref:baseplate J/gp47 family protein n=1 Tax=Mariniphaga sp. TaxID=1954475 RepID=UPI0035617E78